MESVKKPAAHFFKACRLYNGGIQHDKKEYHWENGIQSVSPLSKARVSTDAVGEVHPNKVPIRINCPQAPTLATPEERDFLDNDMSEPPLVFKAGIPHVMVDPENDLFCFSSFGNDWNPDETFSGGNAFRQKSPVARVRRIGVGLPPLTRRGYVFDCKDCGDKKDDAHACLSWRANPPHYCHSCVGGWVAHFRNLEQVFLIVPGLTKADPDDEVTVYRFGYKHLVEGVLEANETRNREDLYPIVFDEDLVYGETIEYNLVGVKTVEDLGSDGPLRFEGNGITLHEANAWQLSGESYPEFKVSHKWFLEVLFETFCGTRENLEENGGGILEYEWGLEGFPACPPPETAKIAGGVVEFRILTYQLHDGHE